MRSITLIIVLAFLAQGQCFMDKLVDKLVDKLLDRALKVSPIQQVDVDETALGKLSHLPVPLQSSPHFATSRLPAPLPLTGQPRSSPNIVARSTSQLQAPLPLPLAVRHRPFPNNIARGMGSLEDFKQRSSAHRLATAPGAIPAARSAAVAESPTAAVEALEATGMNPKHGQVEEIHSEEDFDNFLQQSSGLVVIEAVSTWCRACKAFARKYARMAQDYSGKASFLKVVLNENASTNKLGMERLGVKATPSFFVFLDGRLVGEATGVNERELRSTLDDCLLLQWSSKGAAFTGSRHLGY